MRPVLLAIPLLVSLGFAASAAAQDQLTTVSGQVFDGKILSSDGTTVEFQTDEGMTMKLPVENLTPVSQYVLKRSMTPDDSDEQSQLALAEWCVSQTLYREARRHYELALEKATPEEKTEVEASLAKARTTAADELLQRAKTMQENNRPEDARQVLSVIVQELPDEAAATEATDLLAADTERKKAAALKKPNTAAPASGGTASGDPPTRSSGEEYSAEAQTLFAPVVKLYHSILDNTQKGLSEKNQSRSIKAYEAAIKDGDKALKEVDKIRPQGSSNDETAEALTLVDGKLESAIVDSRIQLSNAYMLRTSYTQAADVVKAGLAQYPNNDRLNQAMGNVISAQSSDGIGGGGWILRGGGIPIPSHRVGGRR